MLNTNEIGLIKGLLRHKLASQQQIIAAFSFPNRTIHHNVVSDISRGTRYSDDASFPPASEVQCRAFINPLFGLKNRYKKLWNDQHSPPYSFSYSYHPVGQGLFCSGLFTRRNHTPFRWVFDCGTEKGSKSNNRRNHVRHEIEVLKQEQAPSSRAHLDLVALSHFDEDHLSGIVDLITTFSVDILLLPYLAPWDRLLIALDRQVDAASDLLRFLLEPTEFLANVEGAEINRIILVPPGGEGPALEPLPVPDLPDLDGISEHAPPNIEIKGKPIDEGSSANGLNGDAGLGQSNVKLLEHGSAITVDRNWEFVPYNDASLHNLTTVGFKTKAGSLAKKLVGEDTISARQEALDALIQLYDSTFKTPNSKNISSIRRNKISLFLYSGPVGDVELKCVNEEILRHGLEPKETRPPLEWLGSDRFGQFFTGDGYLNTKKQWSDFETFYSAHGRLKRGAVFQVMHHGSKANWHPGLAAKINPMASLFCSDPAGKHKHPSEAVLKDYSLYNPVQVDASHGWKIQGFYQFK